MSPSWESCALHGIFARFATEIGAGARSSERCVVSVPSWLSQLSRLAKASLHHRDEARAILQDTDVGQYVAIDHQDIGQLVRLQRAELGGPAHDLGPGPRAANDRF